MPRAVRRTSWFPNRREQTGFGCSSDVDEPLQLGLHFARHPEPMARKPGASSCEHCGDIPPSDEQNGKGSVLAVRRLRFHLEHTVAAAVER
jgi:hypothetical protein